MLLNVFLILYFSSLLSPYADFVPIPYSSVEYVPEFYGRNKFPESVAKCIRQQGEMDESYRQHRNDSREAHQA